MKVRRSTIVVLIVVGLLITMQGLLGNVVADQFQVWLGSWLTYVPHAFALISVGLIGFTVRDQLANATTSARSTTINKWQLAHNRRAMLEKVRLIWIDGVLNASLYKEALIRLSMEIRPLAVIPPLGIVVQRQHHREHLLAPNTRIVDVFDDVGGTLLILGAPGAGKTTLLLELARDLLSRAEQDIAHPIPVIFPLSSWAERRLPLDQWLVDELTKRYDVPGTLAQTWIDTDTVLPLLDGLDEVSQPQRLNCLEAINTYRHAHDLLPLVVSSRIADYEVLTAKLQLQGAIYVQPLSREQVKAYLRQIGLRVAPSSTSPLWDILDTPLMLNIATLTYAGQLGGALPEDGTPAQQRDRLFAGYVHRMFERRPTILQEHNLSWLRWLAWHMQRQSQTVFYLEHLQPEWLPTRSARWQYALLDRVVIGLVIAQAVSMVTGGLTGLSWRLQTQLSVKLGMPIEDVDGIYAVLSALAMGLVFWVLAHLSTLLIYGLFGGQRSVPQRITQRVESSLIGGLLTGVLSGIFAALLAMILIQSLFSVYLYGGIMIVVGGLGGSLAGALVGMPSLRPRHIRVIEALSWSWLQAWRSMIAGLAGGLLIGLIYGIIIGIAVWLTVDPITAVDMGMRLMLILGVMVGVVAGLVGGLIGINIEEKVHPNQGIRRSGRNALLTGIVFGVIMAALPTMFYMVGFAPILGLMFGLVVGLAQGGYAFLSHIALRIVLAYHGSLPIAAVYFLDENSQRILLRKVGGGYIFIHRMLLDYFARQYNGPETTSPQHANIV